MRKGSIDAAEDMGEIYWVYSMIAVKRGSQNENMCALRILIGGGAYFSLLKERI